MTICSEIRPWVQDRLDGPVAVERAQAIDAHLGTCRACRDYDAELRAVVAALRDLPATPFPDAALEEVWRRTSRAPRRSPAIRLDWRVAVAAAIVTAALLPSLFRPIRTGPSPVEIARARGEARLVLGLAGQAIRSTERARDHVLNEEISRAFRQVPIRRPARDLDDARRPRS